MYKLKSIILFLLMALSLPGLAQQQEYPYADDIRHFKEIDRESPPPPGAILFIGSSSFTIWKDVQDYFPGYVIINRGFGGSTLLDQIHYAKDVIFPYDPKQIVIYCGENDLAYSDTITATTVFNRFKTLFGMIRDKFPAVKVTYVSMKPSPSRWNLADKFIEGNRLIRDYLKKQKNTSFVNIWDKMLNQNHRPIPSIYLPDSLHMNASGYKIWQKAIGPELEQ